MHPIGNRTRLEFLVPSRGLFGYRSEFMTDTKGEGIMNSTFDSYKPYFGDIPRRTVGSLIAWETGPSITYGLFNAQERGTLFIGAGVPVYEEHDRRRFSEGQAILSSTCARRSTSRIPVLPALMTLCTLSRLSR